MTYREWMDEIRLRVVDAHGDAANPALDAWELNVGTVDPDAVQLLREVRSHATVALLSNGTTRLRRDLHVLGIDTEFDQIFNTAELGVGKPSPEVFLTVCEQLGLDPTSVAFVDDLPENVDGARGVGIRAHVHVDLASTRAFLRDLGLDL
jgi:putative hydrolase of the HAD superfamily